MKTKIALTGASGNMGREALRQLMELEDVVLVRILLLNTPKDKAYGVAMRQKYGKRLQTVIGNIADLDTCRRLVADVDYVIHLAAVIPPVSDHKPDAAYACNFTGTCNLVDAVKELGDKQPKFVHTSTVAVYGNRNYLHPWGRVGDPLLPSAYDCYAAGKLKAERYVLEAELKCWAVLRQTAMLHNKMLTDNMKDGLMFHTCINAPLEWVTARDSGLLIKNLIKRDLKGEIPDFWKRCYNIGGGEQNRITGYETFDGGFRIIGGSVEKFMKPEWQSIRNFHGLWFADGDLLNNYFDYQHDSVDDYWKEILSKHRYYKIASVVPSELISKLAIQRLLKDINAPRKWIDLNDKGKVKAYFGSKDNISCLSESWEDYPILAKGRVVNGTLDYQAMRKRENTEKMGYLLNHGYDESKADCELDIEDMRQAAEFRGGKCLSETMVKGDLYSKLSWECHDGHRFEATPYTVLKCGHWCPICCQPQPWDFDRLAKFIPFYAQVWYDSHAKEENCTYFFDSHDKAQYTRY